MTYDIVETTYETKPIKEVKLLQFTNPVFRRGFNVTVRKGTKWSGVKECRVQLGGEYITYVDRLETQVKNLLLVEG